MKRFFSGSFGFAERVCARRAKGAKRLRGVLRGPGVRRFCRRAAFSLVEVVIAVGLFGFVVLAIMGTMTMALNSTKESEMRLRAAHVATAILGAVKADPAFGADDANEFPLPDLTALTGSDDKTRVLINSQGRKVGAAGDAAFLFAYKLAQDAQMPNLIYCNLEISWPPEAPPGKEIDSYKVASSVLLPQ